MLYLYFYVFLYLPYPIYLKLPAPNKAILQILISIFLNLLSFLSYPSSFFQYPFTPFNFFFPKHPYLSASLQYPCSLFIIFSSLKCHYNTFCCLFFFLPSSSLPLQATPSFSALQVFFPSAEHHSFFAVIFLSHYLNPSSCELLPRPPHPPPSPPQSSQPGPVTPPLPSIPHPPLTCPLPVSAV